MDSFFFQKSHFFTKATESIDFHKIIHIIITIVIVIIINKKPERMRLFSVLYATRCVAILEGSKTAGPERGQAQGTVV